HITDQAKALFRSGNTDLAVISEGLTGFNAWEDISEDIIIWLFKKCGISNCLSGKSDENSEEEDSDENNNDFNKNDEDSDEYENENSDETGDKDSDKNEYEDSDKNKDENSGKDDEESDKNNNESDNGNKSNNKMSEYFKWPECFVYID
ncbi:37516_t:CDS:2, partial [Gigaspora margarita]